MSGFNFFTEVLSPLDQFEIRDLLSLDIPVLGYFHFSITNIGFYLTIGLVFIIVIYLLSTNYDKLVSNKWSASQESLYDTILSIPGMNDTVKIDLKISRRNVLLLNRVIERGLTNNPEEQTSNLLD